MANRITREIRRIERGYFNLRYFNLVVGTVFFAASLTGTLLMKALKIFEAWPKFWMVGLFLISFTVASLIVAHVFRNIKWVQVVSYGVAVMPLALIVMSFIDRQFDDWTYKAKLLESGKWVEGTMNATNYVYGAGLICTFALLFMTVWVCLFPKWILRPKSAGLTAIFAYLCGIVFSIILFGTVFTQFWTVVFSLPAYAYVIFTWAYQARGSITLRRACRVPLCSFTQIVDWAKSINEE